MAQPFLERLETLVEGHLGDEPALVCKHFFSGAALYAHGTICASLTPVGLAFKLPEKVCAHLLDSGAAHPLKYFEKSPVKKGYVVFPRFEKLSDLDTANYFKSATRHVRPS